GRRSMGARRAVELGKRRRGKVRRADKLGKYGAKGIRKKSNPDNLNSISKAERQPSISSSIQFSKTPNQTLCQTPPPSIRMHYSTLLSVALAAFTLTPSILTHAIPKPIDLGPASASDLAIRADNDGPPPMGSNDESMFKYIEDAMKTIEDIPDSVLDGGDEAVRQWALAHGAGGSPQPATPQTTDTTTLEKRQGWVQVAKCAFAIGKAIAENAFPISKLRRIRDLIR
ncbi:MAG: hypothetical protein Q9184_008550, partial [Pyrenodesmia sp. 2 TL-2023]